jgi:hypothetical protein
MNTVLSVQVSLFHASNLPVILSPTTCCRPRSLVWFLSETYRAVRPSDRPHPFGTTASWASPLASRLATTTGRIEFVILRTNRSPPVALHPSLRRRSYVQLQCSNRTSTGTGTPQIQHAYKRTSRVSPKPAGTVSGQPSINSPRAVERALGLGNDAIKQQGLTIGFRRNPATLKESTLLNVHLRRLKPELQHVPNSLYNQLARTIGARAHVRQT